MLAEKLYQLNSFQRQYEALLILSVGDSISAIERSQKRDELLSLIDWNNILGIASVLCQSQNSIHLDAALRIAQTCLVIPSCTSIQKSAAAYVLESLTNRLAIEMSIKRNFLAIDYANAFSIQQKIETSRNIFQSSVFVNDQLYALNKFQSEVYNKYKTNDAISISAPTSAGKSFILCTILTEALLQGRINVIYIVPTRALISQVESDLNNHFHKNNIKNNIKLSTVPPIHEEVDLQKSNIFVFTQERLHWFLVNNSETHIPIDLLIIDEAHKIEDGNRGILLQQKLEELISENEHIKVYFSSPFTSNPEILLENVHRDVRKAKVNTQFVAVNQNLIYVSQVPLNSLKWSFSLVTTSSSYNFGCITLKDRPNGEYKKIALIAQKIAADGSCLIYSNGAAEAEKIADLLYNTLNTETYGEQIQELIDLVRQTIHPKYTLATVLEKRIAFHYGNMPLLIRSEIERLFSEGVIRYLICTSTLLEGVNLPAKSIIIRNPRRGKKNPLNANDFWNLAGRAGRWGKEFCGNIICIEPDKWDIKPNPNKSKQIIVRAIDVIEQNGADFLEYLNNDTPREKMNLSWESAVGYYYIKYIINKEPYSDNDFNNRLIGILTEKAKRITLPDYIIRRNPGISPIAQQQLYDYFAQKAECIEEYIPVYPHDSNALNEYEKLVGRIGETLNNYPQQLNTSRAILLINWMTGKPLSYIIRKSFESYQRNPKYKNTKNLPVVIREVMDNIETFVRFSFAKDSSCYVDILRYFLELHNKQERIRSLRTGTVHGQNLDPIGELLRHELQRARHARTVHAPRTGELRNQNTAEILLVFAPVLHLHGNLVGIDAVVAGLEGNRLVDGGSVVHLIEESNLLTGDQNNGFVIEVHARIGCNREIHDILAVRLDGILVDRQFDLFDIIETRLRFVIASAACDESRRCACKKSDCKKEFFSFSCIKNWCYFVSFCPVTQYFDCPYDS